jgi:hypothetical protein
MRAMRSATSGNVTKSLMLATNPCGVNFTVSTLHLPPQVSAA